MSFLSEVTIPNSAKSVVKKEGFFDNVILPTGREQELFSLRKEAAQLEMEAQKTGGFGGIFKETAKDVFEKVKQAGITFGTSLFETYKQAPKKFVEDITAGAEDIRRGKILKGITKAGFRTAGDAAQVIFAPIGAAIGAGLELTGGQQLIDKAGQVVADKSGITDLPAFQKFAIEHPNAGEDFERLLLLFLAKGDKGQIDPARMTREIKTFANKLVFSETPPPGAPTIVPQVKGGFLEQVESPIKAEPRISPFKEEIAEEFVKAQGEKPSKVGISIEERAIEKKLTEGFEGTAGFDPITIKEQARLVSELIAKDIEQAKRMVRGEESVPDNLRGASLITGLEEYALQKGDARLLRDLAKSPLTAETSRFAQELRILAERSPESPVKIIQDVAKVRETAIEKRTGKKVAKAKQEGISEIKAEIKKSASKRPTWEEFTKELTCNF